MAIPNREFLAALDDAGSIVLTGHERPDGDCLGSQVALWHLLRSRGKRVRLVEPDAPAPDLDLLLDGVEVTTFDASVGLGACDLVVLLDCATLGRLGGGLGPAVRKAGARVAVIDHHIGSEAGDGEDYFVDHDAAATGELVYRLFRHYAAPISPPAAVAMYVALVADTGWFRYSNTNAEVFRIASELTAAGADPAPIYDALNRRNHPESVEFLADAIGRSRFALDGRFGWIALPRRSVDLAHRIGFDLDSVMEPLRSVRGIEVVALLKQTADDTVRVSLRSSHDVDVQAIARGLGGGGHRKAAGATCLGNLDGVRVRIEHAVRASLQASPKKDGSAR